MSKQFKSALTICIFILTRPLAFFLSPKRGRWIVGGDREHEIEGNSLYFFEYVLKNHPEIDLAFISRKKSALRTIREMGGKAFDNYSLRGLCYALTAEVYFFSLSSMDVRMVNSKKTLLVNLFHGAPLKKIIYDAASSSIVPSRYPRKRAWWNPIIPHCDSDMILTTSSYFVPFMKTAFLSEKIAPLGLPRNDILLQKSQDVGYLKSLKQRIRCDGKRIVAYLPTHRNYGAISPPVLFAGIREKIAELGDDVVILTKQHPLTPCKHDTRLGDRIFCLDQGVLTTQELLLIADVLITDYSSVFVDYILLERPVLFYCFDLGNVGLEDFYFFGEEELPGPLSTTEDKLLADLRKALAGTETARIRNFKNRYHDHPDALSCERIFNAATRLSI